MQLPKPFPKLARIVYCPVCDGEGVEYFGSPNAPYPREAECDECGGTGRVLQRIELEEAE